MPNEMEKNAYRPLAVSKGDDWVKKKSHSITEN